MPMTRILFSILLLFVGCSDDDTSSGNVNPNDGGVVSDGGAVGGDAGGTSGDAGAGAMQLNDGQALDAMINANGAEVTIATTAQPNLTNSDAREFASMMSTVHATAADDERALGQAQGITPEPSFATALIMSTLQQDLQTLSQTPKGNAYDLAYICAQVRGHATIVAFIDSFTGGVVNPALAAEVQNVRATAADHLARAQAIANDLSQGSDAGASCTSSKLPR